MNDHRVLVPVSETPTLRETVEYAVTTAIEDCPPDSEVLVRFVYLHPMELIEGDPESDARRDRATELLSRVAVWAETDAGERAETLTVETGQLGHDSHLFSPQDLASRIEREAANHDVSRVIFDPEYDPGIGVPLLRPLEIELARGTALTIEEAPVEREVRRVPLVGRATAAALGTLFGLSFVFYQVLGGALDVFDVVTGAISATIVAVGLSQVTITRDPDRHTLMRMIRLGVYTPYLLYEIVKSNVIIAAAILHPKLPIDPRSTRIRTRVWGPLATTTYANSITLTPGTLTVRVRGQHLVVHTLVPWAREGLFDGALEKAVRYVFYGRRGMSVASPRERGEAEVLQPAPGEERTGPTSAERVGDDPGSGADGDRSESR